MSELTIDHSNSKVQIGYITRTHGLDGKVVVFLTTDVPDRLKSGDVVYLDDILELTIKSVSNAKGKFLVAFESISTIELAQQITRKALWAFKVEHDFQTDLWVSDLFGSYVVDQNYRFVGSVKYIIENPASDILELDTGVLIPFKFIKHLEVVNGGNNKDEIQIVSETLQRYFDLELTDNDKIAFAELPDGILEINATGLDDKGMDELN